MKQSLAATINYFGSKTANTDGEKFTAKNGG
jgi:hypothetical protein